MIRQLTRQTCEQVYKPAREIVALLLTGVSALLGVMYVDAAVASPDACSFTIGRWVAEYLAESRRDDRDEIGYAHAAQGVGAPSPDLKASTPTAIPLRALDYVSSPRPT